MSLFTDAQAPIRDEDVDDDSSDDDGGLDVDVGEDDNGDEQSLGVDDADLVADMDSELRSLLHPGETIVSKMDCYRVHVRWRWID